MIRDAIREETRLTASAGIAPNKFLAKITSDWNKPDGQFVLKPAQVDAFLAPLAVGRLPGVGKVMEARLAELGIATCSDLREAGGDALVLAADVYRASSGKSGGSKGSGSQGSGKGLAPRTRSWSVFEDAQIDESVQRVKVAKDRSESCVDQTKVGSGKKRSLI
jgi:hypothetical protein